MGRRSNQVALQRLLRATEGAETPKTRFQLIREHRLVSIALSVFTAAALVVGFFVDINTIRGWFSPSPQISAAQDQPVQDTDTPQTTAALGITASARLPKKPNLAPSTFVIRNGPYELTAIDKLCDWPLIETGHNGKYVNNGTSESGPRLAVVAPHAEFRFECAAPGIFDDEWKVTNAIVAVDLQFGVTGRVGRHYARFEFKLEDDREQNWIWTLTEASSGPVSERLDSQGLHGEIENVAIGTVFDSKNPNRVFRPGIFLLVRLKNSGPPSTADNWKLSLVDPFGSGNVEAIMQPLPDTTRFAGSDGIHIFRKDQALYEKAIAEPIPEGGQIAGILAFSLPLERIDQVAEAVKGKKLALTFTDAGGERKECKDVSHFDIRGPVVHPGIAGEFEPRPR